MKTKIANKGYTLIVHSSRSIETTVKQLVFETKEESEAVQQMLMTLFSDMGYEDYIDVLYFESRDNLTKHAYNSVIEHYFSGNGFLPKLYPNHSFREIITMYHDHLMHDDNDIFAEHVGSQIQYSPVDVYVDLVGINSL